MATSTPENKGPDKDVIDLLESEGVHGRKEILYVEGARADMEAKHQAILDTMRTSHGEWSSRGAKNLLKLRTAQGEYKSAIKEEAKKRATDIFNGMDSLAGAKNAKLKRLSRMSAQRLAELSKQVEVSQEVLDALRSEQDRFKDLRKDYTAALDALKASFPFRSRLPWGGLSDEIKDPLDVLENQRLQAAANEVMTTAKGKKAEFERAEQEKFGNVREVERRMRTILLTYKPDLVEQIDELMALNANGEDNLKMMITDLMDGDPSKEAELKSLLKMADLLASKRGQHSELFYKMGQPEIKGQGDKVLGQVMKLRLGAPVSLTFGNKNQSRYLNVWATAQRNRLILREKTSGKKWVLDGSKKKAWYIKNDKVSMDKSKNHYSSLDLEKVIMAA